MERVLWREGEVLKNSQVFNLSLVATLTTQLWCRQADSRCVSCLSLWLTGEESIVHMLFLPSSLHSLFCAELCSYFLIPICCCNCKFFIMKRKKRLSRPGPEPFGQRVHCPLRLSQFNSLRTAFPFVDQKCRLFWSSFRSLVSFLQCAELSPWPNFSFLQSHQTLRLCLMSWSITSLILSTEGFLPFIASTKTWFTYSL